MRVSRKGLSTCSVHVSLYAACHLLESHSHGTDITNILYYSTCNRDQSNIQSIWEVVIREVVIREVVIREVVTSNHVHAYWRLYWCREGKILGRDEGRILGLQQGFQLGFEVGYYAGCLEVIKCRMKSISTGRGMSTGSSLYAKMQKQMQALDRALHGFPFQDPHVCWWNLCVCFCLSCHKIRDWK